MCGIVGYVGHRRVIPVLLEGLKRLEYRGYDSAGIACLNGDRLLLSRAQGKLINLDEKTADIRSLASGIGLGHTRWATHGEPSEENAHPHRDCHEELVVVHNGIIENYHSLRERLKGQGHHFRSDTDTEVIAHLIEEHLSKGFVAAVFTALKELVGSYALGVLWAKEPQTLICARNQSPLVIGLGEEEVFLASDIPALLPWTRRVIFLDDGQLAVLKPGEVKIFDLASGQEISKKVHEITWDASMAEKGGFRHFMLKEIYEQPQAVLNTFRGRLNPETGEISLPEISLLPEEIQRISKIFIVACGTSYHAGLVGKYLLERWVGIPVEVDLASEFRYRHLLIDNHTLAIPISQSGETADTLAGLRMARQMGAKIISICNVLGSTITRESHGTIYTHAGPEIGVASTKAFTSQLTALLLLTFYLAQARGTSPEGCRELLSALVAVPGILENWLPKWHKTSEEIAQRFYKARNFLYLGRNIHFPIALEGALKLKEISYIHAEGYAAGEMKHGPIALIDEQMPVVALAPKDHVYEKMVSNIEEVRSRRGQVISLVTEGDETLPEVSQATIHLPQVVPEVSPIVATVPLQLLAYEIAVTLGCDVDQPRNLAKSVTVE
ncbi:glutamine--fructose-6-phosphate transaminase (isomerizing) [Thermosulfuriphilus ammonigenes]|uniref:Glutamine--fructose-6-phosphate aminotransferase [isomerizing] n=1 Tax=Thermosulfuriphilus ammonigenes TaxID=1936021 RepID=A0A6G7PUD9_9BACT|nr:glutamine--fructose-6-phosphate transaminase (isomerizing) [Thermosulfuriphilus ammonigenes]MBA2848558.1 glucosamine--fructose-6-phosphate aminotransferase (isomerizing) [Thermosulfuriphilus ammonigenes]QIJ71299.1 glutamine--fructose-6-phosphate transaminase (isomerizing) [Thermosulfuriphilus ammonigenes]